MYPCGHLCRPLSGGMLVFLSNSWKCKHISRMTKLSIKKINRLHDRRTKLSGARTRMAGSRPDGRGVALEGLGCAARCAYGPHPEGPAAAAWEEICACQEKKKKRHLPDVSKCLKYGRSDWIRTSDPLLPKQVRYQTAPRSVAVAIGESGRLGKPNVSGRKGQPGRGNRKPRKDAG